MQERKKDTIFVLIFKKSREAFSGVAIILQRLGENESAHIFALIVGALLPMINKLIIILALAF